MLFNSIDFAIFLPVVFLVYWFLVNKSLKLQNLFVVLASYVFYGWWDWRFLSLILFSTLVDYSVGLGLNKEVRPARRKLLLWTSILVNLGFLGFFKYFNFFQENFIAAFSFFGTEIKGNSLNIILPVGISFYTFQTLSYTIDVYRRKLEPTRDFIAFAAFVSFFPQLVAGPIERATNLLPQFYKPRVFEYDKSVDGMRQILWGLFKKIVIADNCAVYANLIFNNSENYTGASLWLGAFFFALQIYGDFSGYSDIAIGTAKLFGFDLMRNFAYPYFSRDIAEFWRRWHISLSTWFRDYLYIPLGGSRGSTWKKVRNTFVIFIVSGFWHGANWTFIAWGALNAIYFLPLLLARKNRQNLEIVAQGKLLPSLKEIFQIGFTFALTLVAWVFFRAENIRSAFFYAKGMFLELFKKQGFVDVINLFYWDIGPFLPILVLLFLWVEWSGREQAYALKRIERMPSKKFRWAYYYLILLLVLFFGGSPQEFIYFQF